MGVVYMRAGEKKKLMVYFSFASHKYIDLVQFRCICLWLNQTYFPQPIDKNRKMLYLCVMKKQVVLSSYCWIISALSTALICGVFIYALKQPDNEWAVWSLGGVIVILFLFTLCFMPLSISLDNESLNINRPLKIKSIPLIDISDVRMCPPTMGAIRICGSGGWFGWYGWFKETDLGKYFAYYGKASDCFLVNLKDGSKYLLGCKDAPEMVAAIQRKLK